jgi:hypothetical protein
MGEVDELFPPSPFTRPEIPRAVVPVYVPVVPLLVLLQYWAGTAALKFYYEANFQEQ